MTEPNAVVFTTTLQWPQGAVGERALLAFEPYDVTKLALEEPALVHVPGWLLERGFERLVEGAWNFPHLEGHVLAVFADCPRASTPYVTDPMGVNHTFMLPVSGP